MHLLEDGIKRIYKECLEEQTHFINTICRDVRNNDLQILFDLKAFYVPNSDFMVEYFSPAIMSPSFDCYDYLGNCKWNYHLVVPIRDVSGNVVGFTGYNPYVDIYNKQKKLSRENNDLSKLEELNAQFSEIAKMPRYQESSSALLDKSKYFICPLGFDKALEDGYLIVVDGFFDCLSLAQDGYNSISILGSNVTEYIRFCLSLVKVIYVAYDNDSAGKTLFKRIQSIHPRVFSITQSKCKDIDEFRKTYPNEFREGMKQINCKIPMSFSL